MLLPNWTRRRLRISCAPRYPSLDHLRCDNGAEFVAGWVSQWLHRAGRKTLFAELGSPGKASYPESFNGKLPDKLLNIAIVDTSLEVQLFADRWQIHYNTMRAHSALGYQPPAAEAVSVMASRRGSA